MKRLITLIAVIVGVAIASSSALAGSTTPQGLKADGLRLQGIAERYGQLQGLKADAMRWNAIAQFYAGRESSSATSGASTFDWGDAGIGAASGLGIAVAAAVALGFVRHSRRTKLAL